MRAGRLVAVVSMLAGAVAGCHSNGGRPVPRDPGRRVRAPAAAPRSPFLVVVIVDQLAAWVADERWPALPFEGGFARLRREGLFVRDMRYAHAVTETAPGHAALFTGAPPRASGIFGNEVIPAPGARPVSILADPAAKLIVLPGTAPDAHGAAASSLRALRVETLADALVAERPDDARVLSASLKDRGALFGGGRHPAFAAWFDPRWAAFVTSSAFPPPSDQYAQSAVSGDAAVRGALGKPWTPLDPAWVRAHAETDDDDPAEGEYDGMGRVFPHLVRTTKALRASPAGDRAVLAVGRSLIEAAGTAARPTLVVLSFSSFDYVSHVFGPHSAEAWDELRRIDGDLAELLATLDRVHGPGGYAVMLTGDHGSAPLPELSASPRDPWCRSADRWERTCGPRRLLSPNAIGAALEPAVAAELGPGPWVAGVAAPWVFLTGRGKSLPPADRARLVAVAGRTLKAQLGMTRVLDVRAQPATCPPIEDESLDALVCRSTVPDGGADLFLLPRRGDVFDPDLAEGHGANHGSPYLYDRAVPLLVRAPWTIPRSVVIDRPLPYTAFTHTAAALLGIRAPAAAEPGPDLTAVWNQLTSATPP